MGQADALGVVGHDVQVFLDPLGLVGREVLVGLLGAHLLDVFVGGIDRGLSLFLGAAFLRQRAGCEASDCAPRVIHCRSLLYDMTFLSRSASGMAELSAKCQGR